MQLTHGYDPNLGLLRKVCLGPVLGAISVLTNLSLKFVALLYDSNGGLLNSGMSLKLSFSIPQCFLTTVAISALRSLNVVTNGILFHFLTLLVPAKVSNLVMFCTRSLCFSMT